MMVAAYGLRTSPALRSDNQRHQCYQYSGVWKSNTRRRCLRSLTASNEDLVSSVSDTNQLHAFHE